MAFPFGQCLKQAEILAFNIEMNGYKRSSSIGQLKNRLDRSFQIRGCAVHLQDLQVIPTTTTSNQRI